VIGSMDDLDAASLEDVHEWFRTYYGPANAVLSIAGDIDVQTAYEKVVEYFGDIPSGPPVTKHQTWIAPMTGEHRQIMQDRVPQARVYKVWNVPEWGSEAATYLDLVTDVLASGKTSRFYKRLVYDDEIATSVSAYISMREIGSQVTIVGTARPGVDLADVERAMDEELERFLRDGPTGDEMRRVKAQSQASFIRGVERIGGFGGKSDVLAMNEVYGGNPDFYKVVMERAANATAADLQNVAQRWLADGVYVLEVHPFPEYSTVASNVDRSGLPEVGAPPAVSFPELQRATLSNGLEIILAERHTVPVVYFQLLVDAGYAADQHGIPGTASLAMTMLDEGTRSRSALEISEELAMLGAGLGTGANLDQSIVTLNALKENLDESLEIFADVILNPSFPEADFERLKRQRLAQIQQEKVQPFGMALRVFPALIYGEGHAYGNPFSGSGTEEAVTGMTRDDMRQFHQTWFKPNNATLVVVGDATLDEVQSRLERLFRDWRPGDVPQKNLATVEQRPSSSVYVLDRPGSPQSVILAGHVAPPKANPDELAIQTMNTALGGDFTSRINMNLREDKHWSYGAGSVFIDARGQRPFFTYAPVQSDKTKESVQEIYAELTGVIGDNPLTDDELHKAIGSQTLTLPGSWETNSAVLGSINQIVRFGYGDDYFKTFADRIRALGLADLNGAARNTLRPDHVIWIVVGDKEQIMPGLQELGFGPVQEIDADGNVLNR
jgi:zinc protease